MFLMETFSPETVLDPSTGFVTHAAHATLHKDVLKFLNLTNTEIVEIYSAQHKATNKGALLEVLCLQVNHFLWAGADIIPTVDSDGIKEMTILEVNTSPIGLMGQAGSVGMLGYNNLIQYGFVSWLKNIPRTDGDLAILVDHTDNLHEVHVFATLTANLMGEFVHLCDVDTMHKNGLIKWLNNQLLIKKPHSSDFIPIRAAFRKVTKKPWTKIPVDCQTPMFNPVLASLAGGQNKLLAVRAFQDFNSRMVGANLSIPTPHTTGPWCKSNIAKVTKEFDYPFVIKCPFTNRGTGVHVITSEEDLRTFINSSHSYDQFIVQSMIGPESWKKQKNGLFPRSLNIKGNNYMVDLRVIIVNGPNGWRPVCFNGRRAATPFSVQCPNDSDDAEDMLKTNVSPKRGNEDAGFAYERVLTMNEEEFEMLGITFEEVVEAYVNSVLATVAIDDMCEKLIDQNNKFNYGLFQNWNQSDILKREMDEGNEVNCS